MAKDCRFEAPSIEEIMEILEFFDQSSLEELRLDVQGLKLVAGKGSIHSEGPPLVPSQAAVKQSPADGVPPGPVAEKPVPAGPDVPVAPVPRPEISAVGENQVEVKSPLLGIFYRAPKPGASPFVEVGSYVMEEDTVALIEVMKLFNTVKAGLRGRIVKICAENNKMVEYGQTLFVIAREEGPNS